MPCLHWFFSVLLLTVFVFNVSPLLVAALLAVVPLPRLLELMQAGARMDVLCKCFDKIIGSSEADSRQILKSNDGARMLPLGLGHPDELVRRTSVKVVAGLVECDEDIAWLQGQVHTLRSSAAALFIFGLRRRENNHARARFLVHSRTRFLCTPMCHMLGHTRHA